MRIKMKKIVKSVIACVSALAISVPMMMTSLPTYAKSINGITIEQIKGDNRYTNYYKCGSYKYFYKYNKADAKKFFDKSKIVIDSKYINQVLDEKIFAMPCKGHVYDEKTGYGIAYCTDSFHDYQEHAPSVTNVYLCTRYVVFYTDSRTDKKTDKIGNSRIFTGNITPFGSFCNQKTSRGEDVLDAGYVLTRKDVPVITASIPNKADVFIGFKKDVNNATKNSRNIKSDLKLKDFALGVVGNTLKGSGNPVYTQLVSMIIGNLSTKQIEVSDLSEKATLKKEANVKCVSFVRDDTYIVKPKSDCTANINLITEILSKSEYNNNVFSTPNRSVSFTYQFSIMFENNSGRVVPERGVGFNKSESVVVNKKVYYTVSGGAIKLTNNTISLGLNESYNIKANVYSFESDKSVTWSTSNSSIVAVSNGKITAKKIGKATISAKDKFGHKATCEVNVKKAPTTVSLNKGNMPVKVGTTAKLNSIIPSGSAAATRTYRSSNSSIVKMTKTYWTAEFKAVKIGSAYVTVRLYNGKEASCKVTVVR